MDKVILLISNLVPQLLSLLILFVVGFTATADADTINYDLSTYRSQPGLTAEVDNEVLTVIWQGDRGTELRLRFTIVQGVPTIRELAVQSADNEWKILATNVVPEFRVVSGVRRVTQQQTEPLERLEVPLTAEKLNEIKWDAFWDAPLYVSDEPPRSHESSIPAAEPFANHPGMPRQSEEISRDTASYQATNCKVRTNGARIEITFPGAEAGIFSGYLQYDIFKGSNLIRQMLVAQTDHPSAAFKYDAGLTGFSVQDSSKVVWRDLVNRWQEYQLGGPTN